MKKLRPSVAVEQLQQNDPSLTGLDLSGNSSYEMKCAYYTEEIGKALARNTHLTSLSLSSLTINDSNVVHIANALKENNTLTYLDLSQNKFGTEGLIAISDALKNNNALIELNVIGQSKDFGENGLTHVMEMLDHNIVLKKIVWRLHSRQSFRINNQITRNNEIERRLGSNMSIEDILPESRRGHALPESLTRGSGKTEVKKEVPKKEEPKKEEPKKEVKKEEPKKEEIKKEEPKKEEPKKEEPKKEEPKKEEPKKETAKPSGKRYDPDRLTWWVENLSGGAQETISIEDPKQKVYISNITDSFVIVTGKCTKISVEKAKGSGIVFDDIISTVEVVNSSKIQLQANGAVPAIQIDSTHGGTIFIQTDIGLDVTIVTALCSGLNVCTPGEKEDDDMIETPIPEQFETKYHENKWHCLPSSHSGV